MRATAHTRPVQAGDAEALAASMRDADVAEVLASGFSDPLQALRLSLEASGFAFAVELGGQLACLGGVQNTQPDSTVWLLTGAAVDRHRRAFWMESKRVIRALLAGRSPLVNRIDSRYQESLRWARRLGAEIGPPSVQGVERVPFCPATWSL